MILSVFQHLIPILSRIFYLSLSEMPYDTFLLIRFVLRSMKSLPINLHDHYRKLRSVQSTSTSSCLPSFSYPPAVIPLGDPAVINSPENHRVLKFCMPHLLSFGKRSNHIYEMLKPEMLHVQINLNYEASSIIAVQ